MKKGTAQTDAKNAAEPPADAPAGPAAEEPVPPQEGSDSAAGTEAKTTGRSLGSDEPDAGIADSSHPTPGEANSDAAATIAELQSKLLRARADYDNLQKRVTRDALLERERVKARVLEHFLQVYEYGRMAATEAEKQPGPLAEGVKMIVREFDRMLEAEGVRPMGAVGDSFDPKQHEAVATEPSDVEAGLVCRVVQPGYALGDRILRYAKVAVAQ